MLITQSPNPSRANSAQQPAFTFPVRIYYEDTDAGGVVYYANYLRFCERARTEWLRTLGYSQQQLLETGGPLFVVRSVQAEYLAPARLDDSLSVISTIRSVSHVSVIFFQRIFREEKLLFTAEVKIVSVSSSSGRPVPWPNEVQTRFRNQLSTEPS